MNSSGKEILGGKNVALEVLKAGRRKVYRIFWGRKSKDATSEELMQLAHLQKIPVVEAHPDKITSLTESEEHQGVAIEVSPFVYAELGDVTAAAKNRQGGFLLLMDEIQDPHNVGALIRTAHLCGASGVVLLKHRQSPVNMTVCKSAAGAQEYLPIVQETNLVNVINYLKKNNFFVWGAAGEGSTSLFKAEPSFPLALVMGAEGRGLRRLVRENCDALIHIPMEGEVGSFNVSVAGGIFMAEILRNRVASS
ncbi:MAG: 23S rRNA (guanosine(2251)-2'-O)-methyltransferase RlmB [Deltaproteobacteria bacterium]|nr:23S rRNA (guanosine(2251)-2'-O)-methyltransferase RlmB [Deltaproteobacteria bacterium]